MTWGRANHKVSNNATCTISARSYSMVYFPAARERREAQQPANAARHVVSPSSFSGRNTNRKKSHHTSCCVHVQRFDQISLQELGTCQCTSNIILSRRNYPPCGPEPPSLQQCGQAPAARQHTDCSTRTQTSCADNNFERRDQSTWRTRLSQQQTSHAPTTSAEETATTNITQTTATQQKQTRIQTHEPPLATY